MKNAREFYEYHNIKQPKSLLPREEFMFEQLNENIEIIGSANSQLSTELECEKAEKQDLSARLRKSIFDDNFVDWSFHGIIGFSVFIVTLVLSIAYYDGVIESKNKTIDNLSNTANGRLLVENEKLKQENAEMKVKLEKYNCMWKLCIK